MISKEKIIYLIRHAKSSWDRAGMSDWERDLNERGRRDGPRMAQYCCDHFSKPDLVLSSDSQRTKSTAAYMVKSGWANDQHLTFKNDLYLASSDEIIDILEAQSDEISSIAILAHNPGIHLAAMQMSENSNIRNFPTFSIVRLRAPINDWSSLSRFKCELDSFVFPKKLFMD